VLKESPGFQDLWQLHYSEAGGPKNAPPDFIANLQGPDGMKGIKISVEQNGAFTITNERNGFSKTYKSSH